jgi:hypothetical protein
MAVRRDSLVDILITSWMARKSNPGGGERFCTCPDRPTQPSVQWVVGLYWEESGWGVALTTQPHVVLSLKNIDKKVEVCQYSPMGHHGLF